MVTVETQGVTFAYRIKDLYTIGLVEIDAEHIDAIQLDSRSQGVVYIDRVVQQRGSVLLFITCMPSVRQRLVDGVAYIDRVSEYIRLVNGEVQYFRTIATVYTRHRIAVDSAVMQGVAIGGV